ncbi:DUF3298 and DUF4163 domain-containing protein [Paenibacillus albicereus]|uniref:DUF3298 and DUF4163 domain-containing protein n=1 Tax=Paenibacillus albicereus TaxID=2726185 RepID=A0A6H2GXA3_9BACL|nr:DUF3298 and DUF4163 domain-containing protein [Paenibacillus albicereus]QJC52054.1 DUF3298 and DUF4163 domain-containing protein [Paenibacillus albicereus]
MPFVQPAYVHTSRVVRPKTELLLPVVSIAGEEGATAAINGSIRSAARMLMEEQGSLDDPRSEMLGYYELKNNQKGVLSLSLFNYAYTGGAHGLTLQRSLTFMGKDGKPIPLAALFKPGSDYRKRLSELVARQIKQRDIQTLQPFEGIRPDQDYYIADRALIIWFSVYEITPYVFGFPYFPISVFDLSDLIREEGPLGVMDVND